jgi:hypothetical protein
VGATRARIWPQPLRSVREDWLAWMPAEKDKLFEETNEQLETLYGMLSVTLDEALALCAQGILGHAREQAGVSADLFDLLAIRLVSVLSAIEGHGHHFGTLPNVAPLKSAFFRGESAQTGARKSSLLFKVLLHSRSKFFHKLHAMVSIVAALQEEFRQAAEDVVLGASVRPDVCWSALEVLHYDLNTCLRETIVVLKSFLLALPKEELTPLEQKLRASAQICPTVPSRRTAHFRRE